MICGHYKCTGNTITMDSSTFPEKLQCSVLSHHWISNEHEQNSVPSRENSMYNDIDVHGVICFYIIIFITS